MANVSITLTKNLSAGASFTITEAMGVNAVTILGTNDGDVTVTGKNFENSLVDGDASVVNNTTPALTIAGTPVSVLSGITIASATTGTATIIGMK